MISKDLVHRIIDNGIREPILLVLKPRYYTAALVLSYSAVDTMAFLNMPAGKTDVMRSDFIAWADRYIIPTLNGEITGRDFYAARCSVLHGGAHSRLSRGGECRPIVHVVQPVDHVSEGPFITTVDALAQLVLTGIERFLEDACKDSERAVLVNSRLKYLAASLPYGSGE